MIPRDKLHKQRASSILIAMVYTEIYARVRQNYDEKGTAEKLTTFGNRVADDYYKHYKPKSNSISGIAREISGVIGGIKKLKLKRVEDGFTLSSKQCPLCQPEIEVEGNAYCFPTLGILEQYLNLVFRDRPEKFAYKKAIGRVLASRACGAEECVYHYQLIEK